MTDDPIERALNVDRPSIARIYDYVLGGTANFEVDRAAAKEFMANVSAERTYARANRDFLRRAVTELCRAGIDQFLDLGSGIPTVGNVHEIAHRVTPQARVAYVDIDPVAVHHARHLLNLDNAPTGTVTSTEADVRDPAATLAQPGVADLIGFDRPVALLMLGILDIIDPPEGGAPALVAAYRDRCPPGSALVISNGAQLSITDAEVEAARAIHARTPTPTLTLRSTSEVAALFEGYSLWAPGVVPTAAWRPDRPVDEHQAAESNCLAGAGTRRPPP